MFRLVVCAFVLGVACKGDHPPPAPVPGPKAHDPCAKAVQEGHLA
ncbi:hypothetical protein BH11MYX1_BH11MYX1_23300 [soil metagenome]